MTCKTVNLSEISLDMDKYCQILPNIFKYCPYCQILPDILQYYQILPISVQNCFTLSDIVKNVNLVLVNIANLLLNIVIYCQYFVKCISSVSHGTLKIFIWLLDKYFKGILCLFQGCFKYFQTYFKPCFICVL